MQMTDTKFMTAKEKELTLKAWERFLKSGLARSAFTKRLYHHLIQNCSFIAHYDEGGFYNTYFSTGEGRRAFLSQFDARNAPGTGIPKSTEYGMDYWATGEYADINKAMIEVAGKYIPALIEQAQKYQMDSDIATASRILGKYGMGIAKTSS